MSSGSPWASPKDKRRLKRALVRRDGTTCWICHGNINMSLEPGEAQAATIDHVIRRRDGGSNRLENLRLAHNSCNGARD